ncbi:uncharacterized protein SCHCODRAFT_01176952 [Schizophyllum commune H4-8]|uniref:Ubiquitin-like protease family profile domain-containing protein n=1 Tax=Schizophyllum commune (strain H4-8 / FGSC 9210) TaxID=578458 RepID=D8QLL4_SCHCM|nr:uncharacterized protein SCHCODRAFT_01176952 [Schizophyllum commune H4-8]KAI5884956.1 hypothetical protein SCHCODRAFT_01176952 [Schizophyllum commune H4-8]
MALPVPEHTVDFTRDDAGSFHEDEWIGTGKTYDTRILPDYVTDAKARLLSIPADFVATHLPWKNAPLPVTRVLSLAIIPRPEYSFVALRASSFFSKDKPGEVDPVTLLSRSIPAADVLLKYENSLGQAWLDGARSIVDQRYNDGRDRMPFWVIGVWRFSADASLKNKRWRAARQYLQDYSGSSAYAIQLRNDALAALDVLPFDVLWPERPIASTSILSSFPQTAWLGDEHITAMLIVLKERLVSKGISDVQIGPYMLGFYITKYCERGPEHLKHLGLYEKLAQTKKLRLLLFPTHVNDNHWIAVYIDFVKHEVGYGDSLSQSGSLAPTALMKNILKWLKDTLGISARLKGDSLPRTKQVDSYNCGLFTVNTIAHAALGVPLHRSTEGHVHRLEWFLVLAKRWCAAVKTTVDICGSSDSSRDQYMEPVTTPLRSQDQDIVHAQSLPSSSSGLTTASTSGFADNIPDAASDGSCQDTSLVTEMADAPVRVNLLESEQPASVAPAASATGEPSRSHLPTAVRAPKRARASSDSGSEGWDSERETKKRRVPAGEGKSKSAKAATKLRHAVKDKRFKVDEHALQRWRDRSRKAKGKKAKALNTAPLTSYFKFDFRVLPQPPSAESRPSLSSSHPSTPVQPPLPSVQPPTPAPSPVVRSVPPTSSASPLAPSGEPCPGITEADDPRVLQYLSRTSEGGGGAPSVISIGRDEHPDVEFFRNLDFEQKRRIYLLQMHARKWLNDHSNLRVFSRNCSGVAGPRTHTGLHHLPCVECRSVFASRAFKTAINKPIPTDENYIYVNKRFRNAAVAKIYARTIGLRSIIEQPDAKNSMYIRFAIASLEKKIKNDVLLGLIQPVVTKLDREERGVGMQNFKYAPAWEEVCSIVQMTSKSAARALGKYLPMPAQRSFNRKIARQPRFPMEICDETFELVVSILRSIGYSGPVSVACDDTKLFDTWRLYYDLVTKKFYLVGGTDGPVLVTNPEKVQELMDSLAGKKAKKVRVWTLVVESAQKICPIIIAALPIPSEMDEEQLYPHLERILHGLLSRGINVVSYACDGTEVERALQRRVLTEADSVKTYTISNPLHGAPDTLIKIAIVQGHPIALVQDSKHALKTFRNNLFSGARCLVMGGFLACYGTFHNMAFEDGSPIYKRDVLRLDRQDDNAAVRLFSAATLQHLFQKHPERLGELVYLFVFGELIDAYQNRALAHDERIKMVLRARYFLDHWHLFLQVAGYKSTTNSPYFLSREAADIARMIIEGYLALIYIHRDFMPSDRLYPFLPWLHSSEACEHVFGSARQLIKDFTMLDFYYMIPKLRIKIRQAILRGLCGSSKATASGYNHTYFDTTNIDVLALSRFPDDAAIDALAIEASQEAVSLMNLLGVRPDQLRGVLSLPLSLPGIDSLLPPRCDAKEDEQEDEGCGESQSDEDTDEELTDAEALRAAIDYADDGGLPGAVQQEITSMTHASIALTLDEQISLYTLHAEDDKSTEELHDVDAEEFHSLQIELPALQLPDSRSQIVFGTPGGYEAQELDLDTLVRLRQKHQTKQAADGTRTRSVPVHDSEVADDERASLRAQISERLRDCLRQNSEIVQGTGKERLARWTEGDGQASGNAANAAAMADAVAKKV